VDDNSKRIEEYIKVLKITTTILRNMELMERISAGNEGVLLAKSCVRLVGGDAFVEGLAEVMENLV
jgi:hypothetical protein